MALSVKGELKKQKLSPWNNWREEFASRRDKEGQQMVMGSEYEQNAMTYIYENVML